ncbi:MAG TPA: DUF1846 domain-containing protein [bacterium]|nr:MAG: hypothetical protein BWY28_01411 [bacterium ADurb.Bin236]HOY61724.1 DUF1846 domain-containing protein [bacterium]HPI75652.1 DUF1846 domain-containing protein [bacterium]HPN95512.1 DUF1846 domain-containing protein [bacterium]
MNRKVGFDNEKYLKEQSESILKRMERFGNKLYLEFGGKILYDYHAARVLPGFDPNVKMRLLQKLKDNADLILCIYAGDIERKKMRADFGITYDSDAMKLIDDLREWGVEVGAVVITRYEEQPSAAQFKDKLERRGIRVHTHKFTKGYPTNVDVIVSDAGYGANAFIETTKPLVVVTGPGPGSGKLATCLSQIYHEHKRGVRAGYAKFETFPVWNIPIKHPVNVAYEAATADLKDVNQIDQFHLEAHNEISVNYNRDIQAFPALKRILDKVMVGGSCYSSPTDMGVNRVGFGIIDDEAVRDAAKQEIIRRYFQYSCEYAVGYATRDTVERAELLMKEIGASPEDRLVVAPARDAASAAESCGKGYMGIYCGSAIELDDGRIVTGKNSPLMHAASSLVMNAIKVMAEIPDRMPLLPPAIIESIAALKHDVMNMKSMNLDLEETLIALSISATSNPAAQYAMETLTRLRGCDVHMTHIPTPGDEAGLRRLGVRMTSDPQFATKSLFTG